MSKFTEVFTKFATAIARWTGRPLVFVACMMLVVLWAVSGPIFGFSDTWQLVINTSTTIITFLMVFLIQNTQNRDNNALHAKLDELIRVSSGHNSFIGIENLADQERSCASSTSNPRGCGKKAAVRRLGAPRRKPHPSQSPSLAPPLRGRGRAPRSASRRPPPKHGSRGAGCG
jgi:low affinity Fe/Cu permease